jgi:hypothetical protein
MITKKISPRNIEFSQSYPKNTRQNGGVRASQISPLF